MKKYKLGSVTDISVDSDDGAEWLHAPPPFLTTENGQNSVFIDILEIWSKQRSEVRSFVYAAIQALDWLVQATSDMNIKKVAGVHTCAFQKGLKEPGFLATYVPDMKTRCPIREQENFIYFAKNNSAVDEYLYKMYKCVSDLNPQISEELRKLVDHGIEYHNKQSN